MIIVKAWWSWRHWGSGRIVELNNGGMVELVELSNRRIVQWFNGGIGGNCRMVELSNC